jgi:hypothetical protein
VALKVKCVAERNSIFEHSGHIGAATLAIVRIHSTTEAANFLKLDHEQLMSSSILYRRRRNGSSESVLASDFATFPT